MQLNVKARNESQARELSLGKGSLDGRPEASYLPEYAKKATGFEK